MPLNYLNRKKRNNPQNVKSKISGDWYFIDQNGHKHHLILTIKSNIIIDQNKLDTKLVEETASSIIFIDKYGYILKINLYKNIPISIYDEAENISYELI
ncbi:DUF4828 domain-containing protein [Xylocopilactobacillus apis]|uniref:DUF4828 domain-containing protein n=1 Tax=Xylocopilactobacillus apis TaxID=2932183 RepID=UPI00295382B7|nr:DUF4828 domain-containing protein [Xylocopilactobacillus apis]